MLIIHATEKLRIKLHEPRTDVRDVPILPPLRWYAHVFTAERTQYILTSNASSLYSIVMLGRGIVDAETYVKHFHACLREQLEDDGMPAFLPNFVAAHAGGVIIAKTLDRSVLGSMNDIVRCCKTTLARRGGLPTQLSHTMNGIPFKSLDFQLPRERMLRLTLEAGWE